MKYIENMKERVLSVETTESLTEDMMWQQQGPLIWRANHFHGTPYFYPVYNYKNYYSYSLLALIIKKGFLSLSSSAYEAASSQDFEFLTNDNLIDNNIKRIGGRHGLRGAIDNIDEYCEKIAQALKQDLSIIEEKNKGFTNIIMCGGKDSMNLLLLPWKNPLIVMSAEPNYPLVRNFLTENNLDIELRRLEDSYDEDFLREEIAELCCRVDGRNWRWAHQIRKLGEALGGKAVVWKGQMGAIYLSPLWKSYCYPETQPDLFLRKVFKKLSPLMPDFMSENLGSLVVPAVEKCNWDKGAVLQGAHMGFMRALTGCLTISAYHGKNVSTVLSDVHLAKAVKKDVRSGIGRILFGKDVKYPRENPRPAPADIRIGAHKPDLFINLLRRHDIEIIRVGE